MSLKKTTVKAIKWSVGASIMEKAISFSCTVILARILDPAVFGLFALSFVVIDTFGLFKSMGFDSALIQRKEKIQEAADTAFIVIPFIGLLLSVIMFFSAPFIGRFLNNTDIISVLKILCILFVFSCFTKIPLTLLQKEMSFDKIAISNLLSSLLYSMSAVVFALLSYGIWSLVFAYILRTLLYTILIWEYSGWRSSFKFDAQIAKEMFHFGKYYFLDTIVWFLRRNSDNALVGKLLGVSSLGIYAFSFNISFLGVDYFGSKIANVLYPAYSKMQNDTENLRRAFLKVTKFSSLFALPFSCGIFLLCDNFINIFLGPNWVMVIPVLKVLIWSGLFATLTSSVSGIFLALCKTKESFKITMLQLILFFGFVYPSVRTFGILGVSALVTICYGIGAIVCYVYAAKLLAAKFIDFVKTFASSVLSSMLMVGVIVIFKYMLPINSLPIFSIPFVCFAALSVIGACSYAIGIYLTEKRLFSEIHSLMT
jgi:O-antigen/teichoic acid export membrane protein